MGPREVAACEGEGGEGETTPPTLSAAKQLKTETSRSDASASLSAPAAPASCGGATSTSTTKTKTTTTRGISKFGGDSDVRDWTSKSTTRSDGRALVTSLAALALTLLFTSSRLTTSVGGGTKVGECRYELGGVVGADGDEICDTDDPVTSPLSPDEVTIRVAGYSVLATLTVLTLALDRCGGSGGGDAGPGGRHTARSWCRTASFTWMTTYVLLMVFILHTPDLISARAVLSTFFPDVGELAEYRRLLRIKIDTVMGSCVFSTQTLFRQLFLCPWFVCHLVGYAWKMAIFRDWRVAFVAGLAFELWEVTLMYFVPEFEECWWDALFLDVFGGNLVGIIVGHHLNRYMFGGGEGETGGNSDGGATTIPPPPGTAYYERPEHAENNGGTTCTIDRNGHSSSSSSPCGRDENGQSFRLTPATNGSNGSIGGTNSSTPTFATVDVHHPSTVDEIPRLFDWFGGRERTTPSSRILYLTSPLSSRHEYHILSSPTRLALVGAMIGLMLILETNQFLLNNALGVPNTSAFCTVRLLLIGLVGVPAGAEWYGYVEGCCRADGGGDDSGRRRRSGDVDGTTTTTLSGGLRCCLLLCFMAMVELAVVIKFFPRHMSVEIERTGSRFGIPREVAIPHLISFGALSSWLLLRYVVVGYAASSSFRARRGGGGEEDGGEGAVLEMLLESSSSSSSSGDDADAVRRWWWWRNYRRLPPEYRRKVLAHEAPDLFLVLAAIPFAYLFFMGWKWE